MAKPSWDEYFMDIAHAVKKRSTCLTRQVGAILVKDKRIMATGYNGTPTGIKNCNEGGCPRCSARMEGKVEAGKDLDKCTCSHGEENAIVQAALHGNSSKGTTMYTTFTTCTNCAKLIINAGIKKVIAEHTYPDDLGTALLKEAGVELEVFKRAQQ